MSRRIWLIGASSGIGLALAEKLLQDGHQLVLSSRNVGSLQSLRDIHRDRAIILPCDVTDDDAIRRSVHFLQERWGAIDCVIYNAGICEYVDKGMVVADTFKRVLDTNVLGLARVSETVLPLLLKGQSPQFVGVSSSAAYLPLPRAEFYGASKAAMTYFLHTLRLSWQKKGICVQVISPGFVKTPLTDKNDFAMPCRISSAEAAEYIAQGLLTRRRDVHFPRRFTLILKLIALLPLFVQQRITGNLIK